jgi:hypothetical protein
MDQVQSLFRRHIQEGRVVSCGGIGFKKKLQMPSTVLAWISGLKVPLMSLGPSFPLQTVMLSDLVGYGSPLLKVMAVWRTFYSLEAIIVCSGLLHLPSKFKFKKSAPNVHFHL